VKQRPLHTSNSREVNIRTENTKNNLIMRIWDDNIKVDLREIEWHGVEWNQFIQDREQRRALVNE
jgi:hypothetical protein